MPPIASFGVGDVEGSRCRNGGKKSNSVSRPRRESEGIKLRHLFKMNVQRGAIGRNLYCAVRNLHNPEQSAGQNPGAEIVQLRRQTDVPEINSYLDESAAGQLRFRVASRVSEIDRLPSQILPFVYADVGDHCIGVAVVVSGSTQRISHSGDAAKIRDAVRIGIDRVKRWILPRWPGKELMVKPESWKYIAAGKWQRLHAEVGYWIDLGRETQTTHKNT